MSMTADHRILKLCLSIVVACVWGVTLPGGLVAAGAEWNEFRGPAGQGHSSATGLPTTWSESENIAWKIAVPGLGWSSPVIEGRRAFLTTAVADESDSKKHSLRALCFDTETGQTVWDVEVFTLEDGPEVEIHKKNSHASPSPIVDGDRVYVHFGPYGTACLSDKGRVLWKNSGLKYLPQHGNGGSPALVDGILVVCCDGKDKRFVAGLDAKSGREVWRTPRELNPSRGFSFCTPTCITVDGKTLAVCPGSGGVWAYDPHSGRQIWRVSYGEGYSVVPRPVFGHGLVFVCSGFGDQQLLAIDPKGEGDISDTHVRWRIKRRGVPRSSSVLLVGNEIYMVDDGGIATCLDAKSGEVHWQQRLGGNYSASPVYADGYIWFQSEDGKTTVIRPGTEYQYVATNRLADGERTFATFAFLDHAILLRSENHLYRIEAKGDSTAAE